MSWSNPQSVPLGVLKTTPNLALQAAKAAAKIHIDETSPRRRLGLAFFLSNLYFSSRAGRGSIFSKINSAIHVGTAPRPGLVPRRIS